MSRTARTAGAALAAIALLAGGLPVRAESVITPGAAAGGVPLGTTVDKVRVILGNPSDELRDPTNAGIIIQRWERLCLGARYTADGALLALDVWTDLSLQCGPIGGYAADGSGGRRVTFASTRAGVEAAFGDAPDRVLQADTFTVLVYERQGIAFYVREEGPRRGRVDAMTVFPRGTSASVWNPGSWGGR